MAEITIRDDLVRRLRQIADQEYRSLDAVLEDMLNRYEHPTTSPIVSDDDGVRGVWLRAYERARRYWRQHDDPRQHMTDEDLDEQFWVIDPDGIPRLKNEQGTITLPDDPLEHMAKAAQADTTIQWRSGSNMEDTKEILNTEYTDYLLARLGRSPSSEP